MKPSPRPGPKDTLPPGDLPSPHPHAQADLQIDRALNALHRTPVDPDLSRRLLLALENHEPSRPRERGKGAASALLTRLRDLECTGFTGFTGSARATAATFGFGALAVAVFALLVVHHPSAHTRATAPQTAARTAAPAQPSPLPAFKAAATMDRALPTAEMLSRPAHRTLSRSKPVPAISPARAPAKDSPALAAMEDDLHAPSHPAPRMPLTAQERLIRRLMRRGEDAELAQLASSARTSAAAHDQAEFQNFFDPPDLSIPQGDPE